MVPSLLLAHKKQQHSLVAGSLNSENRKIVNLLAQRSELAINSPAFLSVNTESPYTPHDRLLATNHWFVKMIQSSEA